MGIPSIDSINSIKQRLVNHVPLSSVENIEEILIAGWEVEKNLLDKYEKTQSDIDVKNTLEDYNKDHSLLCELIYKSMDIYYYMLCDGELASKNA